MLYTHLRLNTAGIGNKRRRLQAKFRIVGSITQKAFSLSHCLSQRFTLLCVQCLTMCWSKIRVGSGNDLGQKISINKLSNQHHYHVQRNITLIEVSVSVVT